MARILYIMGSRHCGSTFFDLLLGSHPRMASLGQVADLYRHFRKPEHCTCGNVLDDCAFWGHLLGELCPEEREAIRTVGPLIAKERHIVRFVASGDLCRRYAAPFDRIAELAAETTAADVLIDSSKNASRAVALLRASRHDVDVVHLVRDSRGMVASHNRRREHEEYFMPMVEWTVKNTLGSTVIRRMAGDRYLRISFEHFMLDPAKTFGVIGGRLGMDMSEVQAHAMLGDDVTIPHIFRGNRQVREQVAVSLDAERLATQRLPEGRDRRFWWSGGFVSRLWGYDRRQSYLAAADRLDGASDAE